LDLFSGIGGFALAAQWNGLETIALCEIDPFARKVLAKNFPNTPIHNDITNTEEFTKYAGTIDLLTGGFPCQPFSIAGKQQGTEDDRDLWPHMFRVIQQTQPTWIIGENVAHFTNMAFSRTKTDLENAGYTVQPFVIPAFAVQAPHRRDRVWIIAHSGRKRCDSRGNHRQEGQVQNNQHRKLTEGEPIRNERKPGTGPALVTAANTIGNGLQGKLQKCSQKQAKLSKTLPLSQLQYWAENPLPTSYVCGVDDGIPNRMDRVKSLGNAIVPQLAAELIRCIIASQSNAA